MKISEIFHVIQGHQITDEEIYKSFGEYPIYTGNNEIKGYWDKTIVTKDMLPCLTYATKAFAGVITIQNNLFDANNTAVMYYKEGMDKIVKLEYVKYILKNKFFDVMTSKENVSYLNKEIVENIDLDIPDEKTQDKTISRYKLMEEYLNNINNFKTKIDDIIKSKTILIEYTNYQIKNEPINKVLEYLSGNSGLTEETIYKSLQHNGEKYQVLSSAVEDETQMGNITAIELNGKKLKTFSEKEGLLVSRNGQAGSTKFLEKGNYTINDHAYILFVKDNCKYKVNLQWLALEYKAQFLEYSSNSDNGTWNMTGFFENVKIDLPHIDEQRHAVKTWEKVTEIQKKFEMAQKNLISLLKKEIIIDSIG